MAFLLRPRLVNSALSRSMVRRGSKNLDWYMRALQRAEDDAVREEVPPFPEPLHGRARQRAFFDVAIGGEHTGRIEFELADDIAPKTVKNFADLCTGASGRGYKGTPFHTVTKGLAFVGGDVESGDGAGGHSSFDTRFFEDENFAGRHSTRGVLSMANSGVDTNQSQFLITAAPAAQLDGRHVAFGVVVDGHDVLDEIEGVFTVNGTPVTEITVADCGVTGGADAAPPSATDAHPAEASSGAGAGAVAGGA